MSEPAVQSPQPLRIVAETEEIDRLDRRDRRLRLIAVAAVGGLLLGVFYTLYFAKVILVPFVLALLLNLVLSPVVRKLARFWVPEGLGAALVLLAMLATVGTGVYQLSGPATEWLDRAPYTFAKLELKLRDLKGSMEEVQEATKRVEELADGGGGDGDEEEPERVVVRGPSIAETFLTGTYSVLAGILITSVGVTSFDTWPEMLAAPAIFLLITGLEGNIVTPSVLGRRLALNPFVIFAAILVWGFLWGIPGVLIAVPLLAAFKILCDNIEPLWAIGQFLGGREQDPTPPEPSAVRT